MNTIFQYEFWFGIEDIWLFHSIGELVLTDIYFKNSN
jgi:hypothetical protein